MRWAAAIAGALLGGTLAAWFPSHPVLMGCVGGVIAGLVVGKLND